MIMRYTRMLLGRSAINQPTNKQTALRLKLQITTINLPSYSIATPAIQFRNGSYNIIMIMIIYPVTV